MNRAVPYAAACAILALLSACTAISDLGMPAGSRQWIIPVENLSAQPVRLFVAEDELQMGESVGTAVPATVAPGSSERVTFTVPPGDGWAIFVNPGPDRGPLILSSDVPPDASGPLPLRISVGPEGHPSVALSVPDPRGWFGN